MIFSYLFHWLESSHSASIRLAPLVLLIWLAGMLMALYRELSSDESVIRREHGQAMISALAKLAVREQVLFLHAAASSHLSYRLARLAAPAQGAQRAAGPLLICLFAVAMMAAIFGTVAHTACCFVLKY